jgi:hypothetical protein
MRRDLEDLFVPHGEQDLSVHIGIVTQERSWSREAAGAVLRSFEV